MKLLEPMRITESAFGAIVNHIGVTPPEAGGLLLGREADYLITKYVADETASTTRVTYTMDTDTLNPIVSRLWNEQGLSVLGIAHSHPRGYDHLSPPDLEYFRQLLTKAVKRKHFYAPVLHTIPDGGFGLTPYVIGSDGEYLGRTVLHVVPDELGTVQPGANSYHNEYSAGRSLRLAFRGLRLSVLLRSELMLLCILLVALLGWLMVSIWPYVIAAIIHNLH